MKRPPLPRHEQTEHERRLYWKEIMVGVLLMSILWLVSWLCTTPPPTTSEMINDVFAEVDLTPSETRWVVSSMNESLHADLTLLDSPERFKQHLTFLVSKVQ